MSYPIERPTRLAAHRLSENVYIRRRIAVASVLFSLVAALGLGAGNVLANRGAAPASASAVRQATPFQPTTPYESRTYLVQPGDTMWSIAETHHGDADLMAFVDALIDLNGGTLLQVGQLISLP